VRVFFGSEWAPIIPLIQILAVFGAFRSIGATNGPMFKAVGRPDYATKIQIFNVAKLGLLIYPFTTVWGLEGVALLLVFHAATSNLITDYLAVSAIHASLYRFGKEISYPLFASLFMGISIVGFKRGFQLETSILSLFVVVVSGIAIYAVVTVVLDKHTGYGISRTIGRVIGELH
jgi:PST family polysaccharide transporter/lipopolysaccharide exporter